ncbi:hypothetical protein UA08_00727 [Talaromyces atroroseus]|uniref:F-box domain-containing protein n=1 Tax=Talaromyces atroroseus TaxID=1441469 RepID=A0A225B7U9_TALAT|nr:hypothetical protein UA08_00727 [Talaromyces atroroseus]OKL64169.1 hypothetical protein UA08_00727 [Talaromyces atroroseus]
MASSTQAAAAAVGTPSRPVRSSRRQIRSYNESSSSESSEDEHDQRASPRRASVNRNNRPKRATQAPRTYREPSSDEDLDRVISRYPEMVTTSANTQSSPRPSRSTVQQASPSKRKKTTVQSPRKRRHADSSTGPTTITDVNESAPPWHTLPYHILLSIFLHAFHPLADSRQGSHANPTKKLLDVALLCRAFAEPALSALYHTPPLVSSLKAHKVLYLLSQPVESLSINYASKVQELLIDVRLTLMYKTGPTYGYFDLCKLIQKVPHLKTLRLFDQLDGKSPLAWSEPTLRWNYPVSLFDTLKKCNVRLHTFDWNCRYMEPQSIIDSMLKHHVEPPFQAIRHLNFFHIPSGDGTSEYPEALEDIIETGLGDALCRLPNLQSVTFTDCTAVNELLFLSMPSKLSSLTLDNCDEVGTIAFVGFLNNHGGSLRELVLKHNRHLNMSFMTILKDACPNLERLSVDLLMHNWPPHYNGMPHFNSLLKADEVPTWPGALQELELLQLRQWDKPRAATFLTSLVNAAPDLKDLRRIVISATVHMGWQDRASFRRQWINKLEHTFLRRDKPPDPNTAVNSDLEHASLGACGQRFSHRQSARLAMQRLSEVDDNDDDDEERDRNADSDEEKIAESKEGYVQGMCDVVSLRIDNLRPADTQFSEGDFLDSEQSGDEDWEGEDWEPENDRHAW